VNRQTDTLYDDANNRVSQFPNTPKSEEFTCSADGEGRGVNRGLLGKPEGKRQLGIPRHRWEDNIKMDVQEVGCGVMDWIELDQDRNR
jgi:hypothetical protein